MVHHWDETEVRGLAKSEPVLPLSRVVVSLLVLLCLSSCGEGGARRTDVVEIGNEAVAKDVGVAPDIADSSAPEPMPPFVAVTFNTGTSLSPPDDKPNDGFHQQQHEYCDEWYGNGLAWKPFVEQTRSFLEEVDPDVVAFQEIFWNGECPDIPPEAQVGFTCEDWNPGDPTVAQMILTGDWQIACNPGRPDNCAAVNRRFGSFRDCDEDFCLDGTKGFTIKGCGKGARVGRSVIDLVDGGTLTLVNLHGTSGFTEDDMACRVKQFEQAFIDLGDGEPAANGSRNLIMGDFNTDPARMVEDDPSAASLVESVGPGKTFYFITDVGMEARPTYGGFFNIDHVISDMFDGPCWTAGVTPGHPLVTESISFDHRPIVCTLSPAPR
jgi:hypothetical protein